MKKEKTAYKDKLELPPDGLIHLDCPECNTPIKFENINIDKAIAKCHHCAALFDFEEKIPSLRNKPEVFMPKEMEVLHLHNELEIKYKWRKNKSSFPTFFTVVWNAFIIPVVVLAILSGDYSMLLFMSLHLAAGIFMLYNTLSHLLNTTYITVSQSNLSIEHRPLQVPWKKDRNIPSDQIRQVYVEKYSDTKINDVPRYDYRVKAILKNEEEIILIKGFKRPESAQYIEQEIEYFLEIEDFAIPNEWKS